MCIAGTEPLSFFYLQLLSLLSALVMWSAQVNTPRSCSWRIQLVVNRIKHCKRQTICRSLSLSFILVCCQMSVYRRVDMVYIPLVFIFFPHQRFDNKADRPVVCRQYERSRRNPPGSEQNLQKLQVCTYFRERGMVRTINTFPPPSHF